MPVEYCELRLHSFIWISDALHEWVRHQKDLPTRLCYPDHFTDRGGNVIHMVQCRIGTGNVKGSVRKRKAGRIAPEPLGTSGLSRLEIQGRNMRTY